jgi:hypothetical protein
MKTTRGGSVPTRICTAVAALGVALTVACDKKPSAAPGSPPPTAAATVPARSGIVSAEKTSFAEVAAHLDPGGSLYGYFSTEQWMAGLSGKVDEVGKALLQAGVVDGADREQMTTVFKTLTGLVQRSGVEGITGIGVSGIALEPGFYQTKVFAHRAPGSEKGYLWTLGGAEARSLDELDWLPANTALAMFGDFDLPAVWSLVNKELADAGIDDAVKQLKGLDQQVKTVTGHTLTDLIGSLGGQQGIFLTLDPARKVSLPLPNMDPPLEIPEPGLAIAVKVKDDRLFDLINGALKEMPNVASTDDNGLRMSSMPSPLPLPIKLQPTVARWGDLLIIATSEDLVKQLVEVKSGKAPGLKTQDEFTRLSKGMPSTGNHFSYVSSQLSKTVQDVQRKIMSAQQNQQSKAMTDVVEKLFGAKTAGAFYAVSGQVSDGWLLTMRGNQDPAMLAAAPMIFVPAVGAGMLLPALAKAKTRAQSIACVSQVKEVCLAALLYANEHNGRLPTGLGEYEKYLGGTAPLVCPSVKGSTVPNYRLVKRGGMASDANASSTVLIECPIHGTKGYVDGHVEAGKKR